MPTDPPLPHPQIPPSTPANPMFTTSGGASGIASMAGSSRSRALSMDRAGDGGAGMTAGTAGASPQAGTTNVVSYSGQGGSTMNGTPGETASAVIAAATTAACTPNEIANDETPARPFWNTGAPR